MAIGLHTNSVESCVGQQLNGCNVKTPRTVKQHCQDRVDRARQQLQKALEHQAKAEVLGINDWPVNDLSQILDYPF
jgi:hypothetical protein